MNKEEIKKWLNSNENKLLVLIIAFAIILRVFYFFKLGEQSIWWDEGDYLAIAKVWASNMETPEWWAHFTSIRPLFIPVLFTILFKIGFSELAVRFFLLLIPSILTIYLVYALGRDLYSKETGLIASFIMSVYWVFFFYSFRLLTDIPSLFLGMLSLYFFWSQYYTKNKPLGLYLSILFGVLAFSTRFPQALVLISIFLFLLLTNKLKIFKDKTILKSLVFGIILLLPYLLYFYYTDFSLFQMYFGERAVSIKNPFAFNILLMFPSFFHSVLFIFLIIGLLVLLSSFLFFDIFWKQQDKRLNPDFFMLLFIIIHLFFYIFIIRAANDRWLLMLMPFLFLVSAKGILFVYSKVKKYNKYFAMIFLIIVFFLGAYQQLSHSSNLINEKKNTYNEIKLAGNWLKENTEKNAKIITASIVQNQYYSERQSFDFHGENVSSSCFELSGAIVLNESCQYLSELAFNKKRAKINPDYMVVSLFEPVFTPQWVYAYPQKYNLTTVQVYMQNNQPILIIYKL